MLDRPAPRTRWPSWWLRCALALSLLLVAACSRSSPPTICPQFETASGVTVSASQFFASHPSAHELCVTGTQCMVRQPGEVALGTFVPTGTATAVTIEVTVLASDGAQLLGKSVRVALHQPSGPCRHSDLQGSVTVTGHGALIAS